MGITELDQPGSSSESTQGGHCCREWVSGRAQGSCVMSAACPRQAKALIESISSISAANSADSTSAATVADSFDLARGVTSTPLPQLSQSATAGAVRPAQHWAAESRLPRRSQQPSAGGRAGFSGTSSEPFSAAAQQLPRSRWATDRSCPAPPWSRSSSTAYRGGWTRCFLAQAARSAGLEQQQLVQHCSAVWQPQRRCWQGKATSSSLGGDQTGSGIGREAKPIENSSKPPTSPRPDRLKREIRNGKRNHIQIGNRHIARLALRRSATNILI